MIHVERDPMNLNQPPVVEISRNKKVDLAGAVQLFGKSSMEMVTSSAMSNQGVQNMGFKTDIRQQSQFSEGKSFGKTDISGKKSVKTEPVLVKQLGPTQTDLPLSPPENVNK